MGGSWIEEKFEEYKMQLITRQQCLSVWELIELVGMGHFSKGMDRQTLSMGINEVFQELILDMLKQVRAVRLQNNVFYVFILVSKISFDISSVSMLPNLSARSSSCSVGKTQNVIVLTMYVVWLLYVILP